MNGLRRRKKLETFNFLTTSFSRGSKTVLVGCARMLKTRRVAGQYDFFRHDTGNRLVHTKFALTGRKIPK